MPVINLAGENVGSKKWSQKQKDKIYDSRVNFGKNLSKFILKQENPPVVFLQGSAIGFYENEKDVLCDEYSIGTQNFFPKLFRMLNSV
jgi:NAD dependent epimerase/dehydratase family enzyme